MGRDDAWDRLVSDLYLSAVDTDAAARLPGHLAALTGGVIASCWQLRPDDGAVVGALASNGSPEAQAAYRDHYHRLDPLQPALRRTRADTLVRGTDVIDARTLARSAYYGEFGVEHGMFHMIGALCPVGHGRAATIGVASILRPQGQEDFGEDADAALRRLLPHLAAAFRLRGQLAAAADVLRRQAIEGALAALGMPAVVTDGHGAVLHANPAAAALPVVQAASTRRTNPHRVLPAPGSRLARLVSAAARGEAGGMCRVPGVPDLLLSVDPLPAPLAALAGAPGGRVLIVLRPLDAAPALPARAAAAFGLTEAEAAVAAALAAGDSPAEIATARGVKISTVRTLLVRAQDKTDSRNLRDLVRRLLALDR